MNVSIIPQRKIGAIYFYLSTHFPGCAITHAEDSDREHLIFTVACADSTYTATLHFRLLDDRNADDIQTILHLYQLARVLRRSATGEIFLSGLDPL